MSKTSMNERAFTDKNDKPDDRRLQEALGKSAVLWKKIKLHIKDQCGRTDEEWKHYGSSSGWTLKVLLKKRNLMVDIKIEC
jgi:hypothetical protein